MGERVEEWASWRPPDALRPYVEAYTGYRQRGMPPARHVGLPSPYLTLIVTLDDPLVVAAHPRPGQAPDRYDALVGGLHLTPATIVHDGAQSGVQLRVTPLGARALLGLPAGALAHVDEHVDAVLGRFGRRLTDTVRGVDTWAGRFAALDALLLARLRGNEDRGGIRPAGVVHPDVAHAWRVLVASGGRAGVGELARQVGRGERHLRELFVREIGLGPKEAARVVRFDLARRAVAQAGARGIPLRLADVAVRFGYYDQAHLDRDFRAFAGAPPSQWLAEELRNVQVPSPEHLGA